MIANFEKNDLMISKTSVLAPIQDLPDPISIDDFFDRVILLQKIETGIEQGKKGEVLTMEEAKEALSNWLK